MQVNDYKVKELPKSGIDDSTIYADTLYPADAKLYNRLLLEYRYRSVHSYTDDPSINFGPSVEYLFTTTIDNKEVDIIYRRPMTGTTNKFRRAVKSGEIQPGDKILARVILAEFDKPNIEIKRFISYTRP